MSSRKIRLAGKLQISQILREMEFADFRVIKNANWSNLPLIKVSK